jgi:hypothetical protein
MADGDRLTALFADHLESIEIACQAPYRTAPFESHDCPNAPFTEVPDLAAATVVFSFAVQVEPVCD